MDRMKEIGREMSSLCDLHLQKWSEMQVMIEVNDARQAQQLGRELRGLEQQLGALTAELHRINQGPEQSSEVA